MITGYSGSRVWDTSDVSYPNLRRGDQSGLSHTEARLHLGYIHCPVPFIGGTQASSIRRLGRSEAMYPWSVGSDYDRPVCRRIIEEAGVPRNAFGQAKKAASVLLFDRRTFLPPDLLADFDAWIEYQGLNEMRLSQRLSQAFNNVPRAILRQLGKLDPQGNLPLIGRLRSEGRLEKFAFHEPRFPHLFAWALERTMRRYATDQ